MKKSLSILVACEESQQVTAAFRKRGHFAMSCDLEPTSGKNKKWHIQSDVRDLLYGPWDIIIAFPPCTHLSVSGARWWKEKQADGRQQAAIDFFMEIVKAPCHYIAVENPISIISSVWRKPDQIIQPWQFGHGEQKATCLWLKNLPLLEPTDIVEGRDQKIWRMSPGPERAKNRSKTYKGVAEAMASQWSEILL